MSRILRHVGRNDFKKTRQRQVVEQKERAARKLKIEEEARKIEEAVRPYKSDWRLELAEAMTTSGMGMINYPAAGDDILGDAIGWNDVSDSGDEGGISAVGATLYINPNNMQYDDGPSTQQSIANTGAFDASKMDTARVTLIRTRVGSGGDSNIRLFANYGSDPNQFYINAFYGETGSETRLINISQYQNLDKLRFQVRATRQKDPGDGLSNVFPPADTSEYTLKIEFQRKTPINVFVGLDDPEANAFIRLGDLSNLSVEDRKKALLEMLDAGDEFMIEYLGLKPSIARPMDTETEIAGYGLRPDGTSGMNKVGDTSVGHDGTVYKLIPRSGYGYNQWVPVKGKADSSTGDTEVAQVAHHELEGDVISEKKKLKNPEEVLKKLPGYYDGKPSPAGFPLSPPIIPVDGQHPELINPVKIANRFNRLDPISARSMPLTGNPHIDKKVKAARKKPK